MGGQASIARLFTSILAAFSASFAIAAVLYPPTTPLCIYCKPLQELLQQTPSIVLVIAVRNTTIVLLYHLAAKLKPRLAIILLYVQATVQGFIAGAGHMPYILRACTIAPHLIPELLSLTLAVASGTGENTKLLAAAVLLALTAALVEATITPMLCLKLVSQC